MAASAHSRWTGNHFQISPQSGCQSWKGSHRKSCCLLFFFSLFFLYFLYCPIICTNFRGTAPAPHPYLQQHPGLILHCSPALIMFSTGGDIRSSVVCHPKETLHWVAAVVFINSCSDSPYAGDHLLCPLLTKMFCLLLSTFWCLFFLSFSSVIDSFKSHDHVDPPLRCSFFPLG